MGQKCKSKRSSPCLFRHGIGLSPKYVYKEVVETRALVERLEAKITEAQR